MTDPIQTIQSYHANGKLLLCGEYFVLYGAKALALPLSVGQQLRVYHVLKTNSIVWKAFYKNEVWFWCELNPYDFTVIGTSDQQISGTLSKIFRIMRIMNPGFQPEAGTNLETLLDTHPQWGFGSSSTLISLLSQWVGINPFGLNQRAFNGSGFDIACAMADGPILFAKNSLVQRVELDYPFAKQLLLVYSGHKKSTGPEVDSFLKSKTVSAPLIQEVSTLTNQFARCRDQNTFNRLIREHEKIVGQLIGQTPVREAFFADFQGEVKSMGAWGGDFYLISANEPIVEAKRYFENKGFPTTFNWTELILNRETP